MKSKEKDDTQVGPIVAIEKDKDYPWKEEQEKILKKWSDKALCFKMMHERAFKRFWCLNAWFNIPVIIISTITGTGNFATGSFGSAAEYLTFAIGAFNIFAGILATIATYTGVAQKLEAHRFASVSWDKFSRKLQLELAKARKDRNKAKDFIKQSAEDYDRLIEISPIIPNDIIRWFTTMIKTGSFEQDIGECGTCCYECFCFACGCNYCTCFSCGCCKTKKEDDSNKENKSSWKNVELPEIIGRIKPTEVAFEPEPETPPPLIIVESKKEEKEVKKTETNSYDIYNLSTMV